MEPKILAANPYHISTIIQEAKQFFGRRLLFRLIYSAILQHQCISLIGSRRIGKSSFLKYLASREFQRCYDYDLSNYLLILINLSEHLEKDSSDFFNFITHYIASQCEEQYGISFVVDKGSDGFRALLESLAKYKLYPVLLIDSFDNLKRCKAYDDVFLSFLRAQADLGRISYITASTLPLIDVCREEDQGSPFFSLFMPYLIEALMPEEARLLITQPAEEMGYPFIEQEVEWILTLGGTHPSLLQRAAYFLFESKKEGVETNLDDLQKRIYQAVSPAFQDMWKHFDNQQREMLKEQVKHNIQKLSIAPELSGSLLFTTFVQIKCGISDIKFTEADLKEILTHMHDLPRLAESKLKDLQIVQERFKRTGISSSLDKGKIIHKLINDALEHLSGQGQRTDLAKDWQYYNVLYLRYIKNNEHEYIAGRLGVSPRTIHRRIDKAIKRLYGALLEIEATFIASEVL